MGNIYFVGDVILFSDFLMYGVSIFLKKKLTSCFLRTSKSLKSDNRAVKLCYSCLIETMIKLFNELI